MVTDLAIKDYRPRIADGILRKKLASAGAVVIRGPKWCGKTETALQAAKSALMMQDPDEKGNNLLLAEARPSLLLQGEKPRLLDEWQEAPQLWDAVRFAVDRERAKGQYILAGSATPTSKPSHSGTGRFAFMDMLTMSLAESGDSTGQVSMARLFEQGGEGIEAHSDSTIETVAALTCRGGWPAVALDEVSEASLETAYEYLTAIAEEDISRPDNVARNSQYARVIMREYARCTATQTTHATIRKDLKSRGTELSRETVDTYIATLRKLYVVQDLSAWEPSLHARSRITKTPKRHFADPSIAVAALGASPASLLKDMSTFGLLFESLCVRDLRVYAQPLSGEVFHYRDETGLEADAVVVLRDGSYALFEMKMSARLVEEGAQSLKKVADKIDTGVMGAPSFCAVLTPGGYAYRRDDGVYVIPITCLGA
ncbi:DUF4143 domain-containing protein [Adlercreutzia sp. R25]|uniref:DUF4143 domain-containing protein n=1 Tax=Adlercreutzia shanghongiae TaxID=3111773 RepID=A0ABU6IVE9_9ACTN|nr:MULTISPECIES: DUF4143 domain-containing protein [unclassified Adlercreutzia]MEC4272074.1 DUF4143 domain-containing protein [Adlercreutzia sp. R25]MEC4293805.1 DUF4143 domain-containing protein [Adlercreutzia sp. R22]